MRESEVERQFVEAVRAAGGQALKFTSQSMNGVPDRLVLLLGGKCAFVELKAPGKQMRLLQRKRRQQLEALGFPVFCVDRPEQIQSAIDALVHWNPGEPIPQGIGARIPDIPAKLKSDCRFCVWKFEKRSGQKTKMPYNPANGDRARINDLRTFADFKTTLMTYAMGGYDGIGIAVGNGIGAFDIDHCIREDGTLNDTAATVLSIFPTAYVEKSPSGKGLRGFFGVPEDFVYDKTVYYINNRSKGLEVYMPGATNRFVTVTGDVYRTGEIPNDETAMTTLLDSLMKRNKQVQNTQLRHHSYLDDDAVIAHAEEASNGDKFKKLYAGDWEELYDSQSDADMALLSNADKQKIENEAAIAKAEADKQVAITNAEAEAQKTSIAADAQAEANRKIAESLSDTLIEYQKIQKWDGKLPTVSGSNALVSIDPAE